MELDKTYINANLYNPELNKSYASKPKVEKVVKPPRRPIIIKSFIGSVILLLTFALINKPNKKQPKQLINKVSKGKSNLPCGLIKIDIKYLKEAPKNPPRPTNSKFFI